MGLLNHKKTLQFVMVGLMFMQDPCQALSKASVALNHMKEKI